MCGLMWCAGVYVMCVRVDVVLGPGFHFFFVKGIGFFKIVRYIVVLS